MIPEYIKKVNGLTLLDRCLLSQIDFLSEKDGRAFCHTKYFASFFVVNERRIYRSLNRLEKFGLIRREKAGWNRRVIYFLMDRKMEKNEEKTIKKDEKKPDNIIRYSREGYNFLKKINTPPTKYHKAPKEQGWTDEGLKAAGDCFERWRKRLGE